MDSGAEQKQKCVLGEDSGRCYEIARIVGIADAVKSIYSKFEMENLEYGILLERKSKFLS